MFVIFDPRQPHIALDAAESLEDAAAALAARPEPGLTVAVNRDGLTRDLNTDEQRDLDTRLNALR